MAAYFRWKPGSAVKIDATAAGKELERIRVHHNGRLDARMVVSEAKTIRSPLHKHFEWNDGRAAQAWRLEQASYLLRSIEVVVPNRKTKTETPIRAFVNVRREDDRSYTSVEDAMADPDLRQQVVNQAWRELEAWRKRHAELVEFVKLFALIDKARSAAVK